MKESTGITIVVAIGIACLIGGSLTKDVNAYKSGDNATTPRTALLSESIETDELNKPQNFVLSVEASKIWTRPFTAEKAPSIETKITDSLDFASKFVKKEYDLDLTSDCSNKRIYVLKTTTEPNNYPKPDNVLDVIEYDDSNKFQRINRVHKMFNNARSIASDWTTGKLYWLEYIENRKYAIKVTNKLFDEPEYVIRPTIVHSHSFTILDVRTIEVYPKKNEIFFELFDDIWYTSNAINSTAYILLPSRKKEFILIIKIDYALDKLYWRNRTSLNSVSISDSTRPLYPKIESRDCDFYHSAFTVFNNVYHWLMGSNNHFEVYMKNGHKKELLATNLNENYRSILRILCQSEPSKTLLLSFDSFTIWTRPYFAENTPFTKYEITDSPNFISTEVEVGLTSDCSNKRIYILKILTPYEDYPNADRVLDVIQYDDNNKFQRIRRDYSMFKAAVSIGSDWTTGNLYWIEKIQDDTYAIKVTNKLLDEPKYVIQPTHELVMGSITVYPKKNELFFSSDQGIWYTSNSPSSTAHLLFSSSTKENRPLNIVIDHALDKLCWKTFASLQCADVSDPARPLYVESIDRQPLRNNHLGFTVFNNIYYWLKMEKEGRVVYRKNNDKSELVKSNVGPNSMNVFFFSPNCPYKTNKTESEKKDQWKNATNFFVCKAPNKIFTRPYITKKNVPPTLLNISDSSDFSSKFPIDMFNHVRLFSGCFNKTIYILKIMMDGKGYLQVLDVIQHNGNDKFQRIKRVYNIFNQAESIALDWTTGKLYWIDWMRKENKSVYSIRVANELFEEQKLVIDPTEEITMSQIQVYPKRQEIFFSNRTDIWYSSTLPNSSPKLLFSSKLNVLGIFSLSIDFALDKLWWSDYDNLYCIYIGGSTRPLKVQNIHSQPKLHRSLRFAVFNSTFYWLDGINQNKELYMKNGNDTSKIV